MQNDYLQVACFTCLDEDKKMSKLMTMRFKKESSYIIKTTTG